MFKLHLESYQLAVGGLRFVSFTLYWHIERILESHCSVLALSETLANLSNRPSIASTGLAHVGPASSRNVNESTPHHNAGVAHAQTPSTNLPQNIIFGDSLKEDPSLRRRIAELEFEIARLHKDLESKVREAEQRGRAAERSHWEEERVKLIAISEAEVSKRVEEQRETIVRELNERVEDLKGIHRDERTTLLARIETAFQRVEASKSKDRELQAKEDLLSERERKLIDAEKGLAETSKAITASKETLDRDREELLQSQRDARNRAHDLEEERRRLILARDEVAKTLESTNTERETILKQVEETKADLIRRRAEFEASQRLAQQKLQEERAAIQLERSLLEGKLSNLTEFESNISSRFNRLGVGEQHAAEIIASQRAELKVKLDEASHDLTKAKVERFEAEAERRRAREECEIARNARAIVERDKAEVQLKADQAVRDRLRAEEIYRAAEAMKTKYEQAAIDVERETSRLKAETKALFQAKTQMREETRRQKARLRTSVSPLLPAQFVFYPS
ncbi:hypothetical protein M427DRAFT_295292 [Gonapodya prolifera JEL478]|uniref:Uncharacterized protein n=1 Tax=Gonapodya prolifera (strain JEL478) TaxID=1344416 RepID=A0A139AHH3_GONPJ|nr:hypothetical protein M427DRAFT_295292 [Gonapodya prolifera JEL478]|eukprot:KXS16256.1 hypothetical protein M427DRAFT_295292 [Gonapodya prolifera JEL478]